MRLNTFINLFLILNLTIICSEFFNMDVYDSPTLFLSTEQSSSSKRSWTPTEDKEIIELVKVYGASNWAAISDGVKGRTGKQCRERYHNHLQPDIKKGDWTEEENHKIVELQKKYGNQWAKITKELPGRTDNAVKNRWHAAMRSLQRVESAAAGDEADISGPPTKKKATSQRGKQRCHFLPNSDLPPLYFSSFANPAAQSRTRTRPRASSHPLPTVPESPISLTLTHSVVSSSAVGGIYSDVPATIAEIVRKYSPRFESEMLLSDTVDLNMLYHDHRSHAHESVEVDTSEPFDMGIRPVPVSAAIDSSANLEGSQSGTASGFVSPAQGVGGGRPAAGLHRCYLMGFTPSSGPESPDKESCFQIGGSDATTSCSSDSVASPASGYNASNEAQPPLTSFTNKKRLVRHTHTAIAVSTAGPVVTTVTSYSANSDFIEQDALEAEALAGNAATASGARKGGRRTRSSSGDSRSSNSYSYNVPVVTDYASLYQHDKQQKALRSGKRSVEESATTEAPEAAPCVPPLSLPVRASDSLMDLTREYYNSWITDMEFEGNQCKRQSSGVSGERTDCGGNPLCIEIPESEQSTTHCYRHLDSPAMNNLLSDGCDNTINSEIHAPLATDNLFEQMEISPRTNLLLLNIMEPSPYQSPRLGDGFMVSGTVETMNSTEPCISSPY